MDERDCVGKRRGLILANVLVLVLVVFRQAFRFQPPSPDQGQTIEGRATCIALFTVHIRVRGLIRQNLTARSGSPESLLRWKPAKFVHCADYQRRSGVCKPGFGPVIPAASHWIDEIGMGPG